MSGQSVNQLTFHTGRPVGLRDGPRVVDHACGVLTDEVEVLLELHSPLAAVRDITVERDEGVSGREEEGLQIEDVGRLQGCRAMGI